MEKIPAPPAHVPPPTTPPASRQAAPARKSTHRWTWALAGGMAMIVATLLLVRYASERPEDFAAEDHLERSERFAATAPRPEPAPTAPALETMPVASAGFAAPVVEEHAPEPVLKARPRKVVTVAPAKKHAAASAKTSAKSTAP